MTGWLLADRRFAPLFASLSLSALGDNLLRNALAAVALWSGGGPPWLVPLAAGAFVAPGILLSGLGGELADRMDKARLIRRLKLAELPVAALAAFGLAEARLWLVLAALVASGVLGTLFSPVKYGILPDQLDPHRLPAANALAEAGTFAAILAGSVGGSVLIALPGGAGVAASVVLAAALASWLSTHAIPPARAAAPDLPVRANVLASTRDLVRTLRADRRSWRAALANAWFWMAGVAVLSLLPGLVHGPLAGGAVLNGMLLGLFALGVGIGSALAAMLARGRVRPGIATAGCALLGAALLATWRLAAGGLSAPLCLALFTVAAGGGLLAVPTQAAVQAWAAPARRARAIAGMNVLAALGMAATTGVLVAAQLQGVGEAVLLGAVGAASLGVAGAMLSFGAADTAGG